MRDPLLLALFRHVDPALRKPVARDPATLARVFPIDLADFASEERRS